MLYFLAASLALKPLTAFFAGALFALHPIHTEAVYMVVGRGELLAAFFGLVFLLGVLENWNILMLAVSFGAALFSKENAAVLPALGILLYCMKFHESNFQNVCKTAFKLAVSTIPVLVLLFMCRYLVFGVFLSPEEYVDHLYNPLSDMTPYMRMINGGWVLVLYLKSVFFPLPLRADYSCCQIELIGPLLDPRLIVMVGILVMTGLFITWRGRLVRYEAGAVLFFIIALLPVINLLFPVGVMFAERLVYLPSAGICILLGSLLERVSLTWKHAVNLRRGLFVIAAAVLILGAATVIRRDRDWQDSEAFTSALVKDSPESAHAHGLRFLHLEKIGKRSEAEKHLQRALEIHPSYYDAWDSYGDFLVQDGRDKEAVDAYLNAAETVSRTPFDASEAGSFFLKAAHVQIKIEDCHGARQSIELAGEWIGKANPLVQRFETALQSCYGKNTDR